MAKSPRKTAARRNRARNVAPPTPTPKPFDRFAVFDCVSHCDQVAYPGVGVVVGSLLIGPADEPMLTVRYRNDNGHFDTLFAASQLFRA